MLLKGNPHIAPFYATSRNPDLVCVSQNSSFSPWKVFFWTTSLDMFAERKCEKMGGYEQEGTPFVRIFKVNLRLVSD